jgi:hypothetical protein
MLMWQCCNETVIVVSEAFCCACVREHCEGVVGIVIGKAEEKPSGHTSRRSPPPFVPTWMIDNHLAEQQKKNHRTGIPK